MDYGPPVLRTHVMMFNVCYYHCILLDPRTLAATTNNFIFVSSKLQRHPATAANLQSTKAESNCLQQLNQ